MALWSGFLQFLQMNTVFSIVLPDTGSFMPVNRSKTLRMSFSSYIHF